MSIGPQQAAETIRTALAIVDRVGEAEGAVEPLAVAKILEGRGGAETSASSSSASRRSTTTATRPPDAGGVARLAAGHVRLEARDRRQLHPCYARGQCKLKSPAIVTTDLPLDEQSVAAQHHEGEEEADRREITGRLRHEMWRLEVVKKPDARPASRSARSSNSSAS